ncbi:MAG: hypothetical protein MUQ65_15265 [Armatimonadetes bacterium]|nr:hypothetical protein [Armatimonadota bacterium]
MAVRQKDRDVLRELGGKVAEIAALPVQQETVSLWKALNGLRPVRAMVMIDEIPWHEMDVDEELVLQTADPFCQGIERQLRRTLYRWKHMRADMVVEPMVAVPKVIHGDDFGMQVVERAAILDPRSDIYGHAYLDQLQTEDDLKKIRQPEVRLDEEATAEAEGKARDIFDGILTVRMQGRFPTFALWDIITCWRSPEHVLLDLVDRPEFTHQVMARLTEVHLSLLDQLEEQGLLGFGQPTIHCTGAYTDELPAPGFDPGHPRTSDLWTHGMAQIFSSVSAAMHQEFELDYVIKCYERFGLVYYGCCEPLHEKMDIVRKIPHLRKISMSTWVDVEKGAERIGRDFVFSRKPSPAFLAGEVWDPKAVEEDLSDTLARCNRHGCPVEFILKDISTVRYQPQRLREWADVAMGVVKG